MEEAKMDMEGAKIFGIGFHKTGTTSLAKALRLLDYDAIHGDSPEEPPYGDQGRTLIRLIEEGNFRLPTIERYDAFTDNPYFSIWKELDREYPGSRFILTIREELPWLESCVRYFEGRPLLPMRVWRFGEHADPSSSEAAQRRWLAAYQAHNREVLTHFEKRPDDLLVMDITKGDGWDKLCPFLGRDIPASQFPRENVSDSAQHPSLLRHRLRVLKNLLRQQIRKLYKG